MPISVMPYRSNSRRPPVASSHSRATGSGHAAEPHTASRKLAAAAAAAAASSGLRRRAAASVRRSMTYIVGTPMNTVIGGRRSVPSRRRSHVARGAKPVSCGPNSTTAPAACAAHPRVDQPVDVMQGEGVKDAIVAAPTPRRAKRVALRLESDVCV